MQCSLLEHSSNHFQDPPPDVDKSSWPEQLSSTPRWVCLQPLLTSLTRCSFFYRSHCYTGHFFTLLLNRSSGTFHLFLSHSLKLQRMCPLVQHDSSSKSRRKVSYCLSEFFSFSGRVTSGPSTEVSINSIFTQKMCEKHL